ncbi:MAG: hypothetical protein GY909_07555 [Oligoflexia bacterium]|nr:hypothetical protein [Oligoflexia bacterium]
MKFKFKNLLLIVILLQVVSCSKIEWGYRFGDWIINSRVKKFVRFQGEDKKKFMAILEEHMQWHKENVLPDIITLGERGLKDIERKSFDKALVDSYMSEILNLYNKSMMPLIPKVTPLLARLNDIQIDRLRKKLVAGNERIEDQMKIRPEEIKKKKIDQYKENLGEWFGEINKKQLDLISKSYQNLRYDPKMRLARRSQRIKSFLDSYDHKDSKVVELKLNEALKSSWIFKGRMTNWMDRMSVFMSAFLNTLTKDQREYFKKNISTYLNDFKRLTSQSDK